MLWSSLFFTMDVLPVASPNTCEEGRPEVTYWIGKEILGQGGRDQALSLFLQELKTRPIYAGAAKNNTASIRVLEKNGFRIVDLGKGFAMARGAEIEEILMELTR
ncbi:MAG TPA: GNAT family protein [Candidatus Bathyarchaeia archaeon]|nr:GNAT family protein [Candidatus Bathyarchaeia archaeon]